MMTALPLAKCVVCVANDHAWGWPIVVGTALLLAAALALGFAWLDRRR